MKHRWKPMFAVPAYWPGQQECIICKASFCAPYDPLDSERTAEFIAKQKARNDCPGKKT